MKNKKLLKKALHTFMYIDWDMAIPKIYYDRYELLCAKINNDDKIQVRNQYILYLYA